MTVSILFSFGFMERIAFLDLCDPNVCFTVALYQLESCDHIVILVSVES